MFPGAELAEDAVEYHFGIVRRKRKEPAARHWQLLGQFCVQAYGEKRADEIVKRSHARTEDDERLGIFPCHHNVVGAHTIGNVVATQCGRSGQALRDTALGWHVVNFSVAVVLRSKSDLSPIRRKP